MIHAPTTRWQKALSILLSFNMAIGSLLPSVAFFIPAVQVAHAATLAETLPIVPTIDSGMKTNLRSILATGQSLGNRPQVFAKGGDSITATGSFLADVGCPSDPPNPFAGMTATVDYFKATTVSTSDVWCELSNSFTHNSRAASSGWRVSALTGVASENRTNCQSGENQLACELRLTKPSMILIMVGTNDVDGIANNDYTVGTYKTRLTAVVDQTIAAGVIPVLSTIPPRLDQGGSLQMHVASINQAIIEVAQEKNLPLWNYWRALQNIGAANNFGMDGDGIHPNAYRGDSAAIMEGPALNFGYNVRNLTALQVLTKIKNIVIDNGTPDSGSSSTTTSTPAPDYTIALNPTSVSLQQGQSSSITVSLSRLNGFTGAVTVTASGLRSGVTAPSITIASGANSGVITLTSSASASVGGPTAATITATSGSLTKTASLNVTVTAASTSTSTPPPPSSGTTRTIRVYVSGESIERRNRMTEAPFTSTGALNNAQNNDDDQYGWMTPLADRLKLRDPGLSIEFVGAQSWTNAEDNPYSGTYPSTTPGRTSAISGSSVEDWTNTRRNELVGKTYCYDAAFASRGGNDLATDDATYKSQLKALVRLLAAGSNCQSNPVIFVTAHMPDSQGSISTLRAKFADRVRAAVTEMGTSDPGIRVRFIDMFNPFANNQATTAFPTPSWTSGTNSFDMAKIGRIGDGLHPRRFASIYAGEVAANAINLTDLGGSSSTPTPPPPPPPASTPDYTISVNPTSLSIQQGQSGSVTVSVNRLNGFTGAVNVVASGLRSGVTAPSITIASGSNSGTMTFSASGSATVGGPTSATLTGTSGSLVKTTSLSMGVAAAPTTATFNISASPSALTIVQGTTGRVTVNIARTGGFTGTVRFSYDRLPTNARASFNPTRTTGNSSVLSFTISRSVPRGSYVVNIRATSGTITRTIAVPLTITSTTAPAPDFTISRSPTSISLQQGQSTGVTVNLTRSNGFTGSVTVSASGLPSGVTAAPVTIASGSNSGTMTFSANGSATVEGPTTAILTGVSGSLSRTNNVNVTVTAAPTRTSTPTPPPSPTSARRYDIGTPTVRDIWVSTTGNDNNSGATRTLAKRTLAGAWQSIPNGTLTGTGYRIMIAPGSYAENTLPNYMELKRGTAQFPIMIQAADGRGTVTLQGDLNMANVSYVYLIDLNIVPEPAGDVLHFEKTDHMLVRGVTMNGRGAAHETFKANQSQHLYVEDSDISGTYENAIDYVAVQYGHIVNSKLHHAGDWCAYAKGGSAYLWVEGNELYQCGTGGFTTGQGTGFEYMTSPWLHYEAYGITFVNNVIHDTEGAGIGVNGGYNIVMAHNTMYRVGQRSHVIEVVFGSRSCDRDPALSGKCELNLSNGGWGTTGEAVPIPNRNIHILNNIVLNPSGYQSQWQHFAIHGPQMTPASSNIPSPARTDTNLNIRGNVIWNGGSGMPLGIESNSCTTSNPTCNEAQLLRDNAINTIQPQFVNVAGGDFRLTTPLSRSSVPLPTLSWSDLPTRPLAPAGYTTISIPTNRDGITRSITNNIGAY